MVFFKQIHGRARAASIQTHKLQNDVETQAIKHANEMRDHKHKQLTIDHAASWNTCLRNNEG